MQLALSSQCLSSSEFFSVPLTETIHWVVFAVALRLYCKSDYFQLICLFC